MPKAGPRWLLLLLTIGLPPGACGGAGPPAMGGTAAGLLGASGASAAPAAPPATAGPEVTTMPNGMVMLRTPVREVATLQRQPDGTFKRVCGAPDPDLRDMIEGKRRARRGGR